MPLRRLLTTALTSLRAIRGLKKGMVLSERLEGRMKYLLVGGAGFIAKHVVSSLSRHGMASDIAIIDNYFLGQIRSDVRSYRLDAQDLSSLQTVLTQFQPDVVIDLSTKPIPHSLVFPREGFINNVTCISNLLECYRAGQFSRLVYFSTSEIYGDAQEDTMAEDHPKLPKTPYAASKLASEYLIDTYRQTYGLSTLVVRPFNNYGPGQNNVEYSAFLPKLASLIPEGLPIQVHGDGLQTRDFVWVEDTAEALARLLQLPFTSRTVNISTGTETSMRALISLAAIALGRHPESLEIVFTEARQGDVERHCGNGELLAQLSGFRPRPIDVDLVSRAIGL